MEARARRAAGEHLDPDIDEAIAELEAVLAERAV